MRKHWKPMTKRRTERNFGPIIISQDLTNFKNYLGTISKLIVSYQFKFWYALNQWHVQFILERGTKFEL